MVRGITCGAFDLLHAGHVIMFEEAKGRCDHLTVALQINPNIDRPEKNIPVQSIVERQIQVRGCKYVDEVIVYEREADLEQIFTVMQFDVRIIGSEYENKNFTAKDICEAKGVEIYYNKRFHDLSTTELRHRTT